MHRLVVLVRRLLVIVATIVHLLCVVLLGVGRVEPRTIRGNEGLALLIIVRIGRRVEGALSAVAVVWPLIGLAAEARRRRVLLRGRVPEVVLLSWVEDRRRVLAPLIVPWVQIVIVLLPILRRSHALVHAWRPVEGWGARRELGWLTWRRVALVRVRVVRLWLL